MVIVQTGTQRHRVHGRLAGFIMHLLENEELLTNTEKGRLEYNYSGRIIKPKLEIYSDEIQVKS